MSSHITQARSLYRRLLRELPTRQPSKLANPSPLQAFIRNDFVSPFSLSSSSSSSSIPSIDRRLAEAEQFVAYIAAQRTYITLVERYNPGMNMDEEEKIRLTARRVGMELPLDVDVGKE